MHFNAQELWFSVRTRSGTVYEVWCAGNARFTIRSAHRAPFHCTDIDARMGEPLVGWGGRGRLRTSPIVELIRN